MSCLRHCYVLEMRNYVTYELVGILQVNTLRILLLVRGAIALLVAAVATGCKIAVSTS